MALCFHVDFFFRLAAPPERWLSLFSLGLMETSPDTTQYWKKLTALIEECRLRIPACYEPDIPGFPGAGWKERAYRRELEEEHAPKVDGAIAQFCETHKWPRTSNAVRYYAGLRFEFAQRIARMLGTPHIDLGRPLVGVLSAKPLLVIEWLCIDVWHERNGPPQPETEMQIVDIAMPP